MPYGTCKDRRRLRHKGKNRSPRGHVSERRSKFTVFARVGEGPAAARERSGSEVATRVSTGFCELFPKGGSLDEVLDAKGR